MSLKKFPTRIVIYLNRKIYWLHNITENDFWKHLDDITAGQNLNPEMSFTTQFVGNSKNVFGGRKLKNRFSIFLYRPITRELWIRILAKGTVSADDKNKSVVINCRFQMPFWSTFILILFGVFIITPSYFISSKTGIIVGSLVLLIYGVIIITSYRQIVLERV